MSVLNTFKDTDFREERDALRLASTHLSKLEQEFPDWWALFDETSPDMAPRADVIELLATAPTSFAIGLLYGKFTMRSEIAAMTGREWV